MKEILGPVYHPEDFDEYGNNNKDNGDDDDNDSRHCREDDSGNDTWAGSQRRDNDRDKERFDDENETESDRVSNQGHRQ